MKDGVLVWRWSACVEMECLCGDGCDFLVLDFLCGGCFVCVRMECLCGGACVEVRGV